MSIEWANLSGQRPIPAVANDIKLAGGDWFDMWRIKDGKADEHWDGATIAAPPAGR